MGFVKAVKTCFQKYATFSGRASRSEFWYFVLFGLLLAQFRAMLFVYNSPITLLVDLISLVMFIPNLAVGVRRLHDLNRSGWWYFPTFFWLMVTLAFPHFKVEELSEDPVEFIAIQSSILLFILLGAFYSLILFIYFYRKGTVGDNRFGPDPLQPKA